MKSFTAAILILLSALLASCSGKSDSIVGKWIDTETEQIYEYTADGYFYEYLNESFTSDKTRYKADGKKITYYLEGVPESESTVEYEFKDGNLIINGILEYKHYTEPEKADVTREVK